MTNQQIDTTTKRLVALSAHGIYITHGDGHRWIECQETDRGYSYDEELRKNGILVNNKIYGGVIEAIDVVDKTMKEMYGYSLLEWYDDFINEEWDMLYKWGGKRIENTDKGSGGLV